MVRGKYFLLVLVVICGGLMSSGCALTRAQLDVQYKQGIKGPLSEVKPLLFRITNIKDNRREQDKIGNKKNGFGMEMAKVDSKQKVAQIVREALVRELRANGHNVIENSEKQDVDVDLSGIITEFMFDIRMHLLTVEVPGWVSAEIVIIEGQTNKELFRKLYKGYYSEKHGAAYLGTYEVTMNKALADFVYQFSHDFQLIDALNNFKRDGVVEK